MVYAGDNDLVEGVSPEAVLASFKSLVGQVQAGHAATRVVFISVKPSPSRQEMLPAVLRTNELVAAYARAVPNVAFVDVYARMVDAQGRPRPEFFQADMLHLNAAGYALWNEAIARYLS